MGERRRLTSRCPWEEGRREEAATHCHTINGVKMFPSGHYHFYEGGSYGYESVTRAPMEAAPGGKSG